MKDVGWSCLKSLLTSLGSWRSLTFSSALLRRCAACSLPPCTPLRGGARGCGSGAACAGPSAGASATPPPGWPRRRRCAAHRPPRPPCRSGSPWSGSPGKCARRQGSGSVASSKVSTENVQSLRPFLAVCFFVSCLVVYITATSNWRIAIKLFESIPYVVRYVLIKYFPLSYTGKQRTRGSRIGNINKCFTIYMALLKKLSKPNSSGDGPTTANAYFQRNKEVTQAEYFIRISCTTNCSDTPYGKTC